MFLVSLLLLGWIDAVGSLLFWLGRSNGIESTWMSSMRHSRRICDSWVDRQISPLGAFLRIAPDDLRDNPSDGFPSEGIWAILLPWKLVACGVSELSR
jgi:hypothetical protein